MKHFAKVCAKPIFGSLSLVKPLAVSGLLLGLAACSTLPEPAGQLSGYENLQKPRGLMAQYKTYADKPGLASYRRVHIQPVVITPEVAEKAGDANLGLVSNAIARDMCNALANSYQISAQGGADTLEIRAFITDFSPTGARASATSSVLSQISPVSFRLPVGLGHLSAEAEALSPDGQQLASLVWSRKANVLDSGGVSQISDAYAFSDGFSSAFYKLLTPAKSDKSVAPKLDPKAVKEQKKVNRAACDVYGKGPGVKGFLAGFSPVGAAPEWSDKGRAVTPETDKPVDKGTSSPN